MLSWMSRTALELIGQAGLGYSFDSLEDEAVTHPYVKTMKQLMFVLFALDSDKYLTRNSITLGKMWITRDYLVPVAVKIGTPRMRRWVVDALPWKNLHHVRDMSDYMWKISKEIYETKKKAIAEGDEALERQVGKGKDLMSILSKFSSITSGHQQ